MFFMYFYFLFELFYLVLCLTIESPLFIFLTYDFRDVFRMGW